MPGEGRGLPPDRRECDPEAVNSLSEKGRRLLPLLRRVFVGSLRIRREQHVKGDAVEPLQEHQMNQRWELFAPLPAADGVHRRGFRAVRADDVREHLLRQTALLPQTAQASANRSGIRTPPPRARDPKIRGGVKLVGQITGSNGLFHVIFLLLLHDCEQPDVPRQAFIKIESI